MSLKTKILGLFKYDPDKDGASTFNIKQALNDNWDKLDNEVAARVKTTELAAEVKKTVKGGSLTASDLGAVSAKDKGQAGVTAEGFLYCLRKLQTGSYYTGDSTGTNPSHSATTLVSGTTTTADSIKINYIAVEYGGER